MEDKLDLLFQYWNKYDSKVLVSQTKETDAIEIERLIAETTKYCRYSSRLTWVLLDWIIRNVDKINTERLLQITAQSGNITVLGLISDIAKQRKDHIKFEHLIKASRPNGTKEIFFYRVSQSKLATRLTMEQNLPIFNKWNFYCNELSYLTNKSER